MRIVLLLLIFVSFYSISQQRLAVKKFSYRENDTWWELGTRGIKITGFNQSKKQLTFSLKLAYGTCRIFFKPKVEMNNDTLNIYMKSEGGNCWGGRTSIYDISFTVQQMAILPKIFYAKIDSSEIIEAKYDQSPFLEMKGYNDEYLKIDGLTLNYKDKYGIKNGMWLDLVRIENDSLENWGEASFKIPQDSNYRLMMDSVRFYKNGVQVSVEKSHLKFTDNKVYYYAYPNYLYRWDEYVDGVIIKHKVH